MQTGAEELYISLRTVFVAAVGFMVGALTGLTGVGIGSLTMPLIAYMFGLSANRARGTAMTLMLAAALPSVIIYTKAGYMDWAPAGLAALGMVAGAIIGTRLTIGKNRSVFRRLVALVLAAAGIYIAVVSSGQPGSSAISILQGLTIGFGAGLIGGMASVAGGALLIPALVVFLAVPQKLAQAVALAVIIPASLPLVMLYYIGNRADRKIMLQLAAGGALGACAGTAAAINMPVPLLMVVFGAFSAVIAAITFKKG
ncbi:MAG: sulfite exporter TauE/SafE family protein [Armatimonadota bacterium]